MISGDYQSVLAYATKHAPEVVALMPDPVHMIEEECVTLASICNDTQTPARPAVCQISCAYGNISPVATYHPDVLDRWARQVRLTG